MLVGISTSKYYSSYRYRSSSSIGRSNIFLHVDDDGDGDGDGHLVHADLILIDCTARERKK